MKHLDLSAEKSENSNSPIMGTLYNLLRNHSEAINSWFDNAFEQTQPLFYNSVDLRHSGYKLAPVDTNIFPAGFNNLSEFGKKRAVDACKEFIGHFHPNTKKVLLVSEDHTRNLKYLDNLIVLQDILLACNLEVRFGTLAPKTVPFDLVSASENPLTVYPLVRKDDGVETTDGFRPDLVIANNDFTTGPSGLLENIRQPVTPPMSLGWFQRKKTTHFHTYNQVVNQFASQFPIDPWLISTQFHFCGEIDFKERVGIECVALGVDKVLHSLRAKYQEYKIQEQPFVFIKADRGTYGMGIMTASSGDEVIEMNKKLRNQMNTIKGRTENSAVIIQEGIPTIDKINGQTAEPLLYLMGGRPADCFYRIHPEKDSNSNLNSTGMFFASAAEAGAANLCPIYSLISRLAALAATREVY